MKRFLVVGALAVGLAVPAWGQSLDKGVDAYERGDYAAALREFRPLAEKGLAGAQNNLGLMYDDGRGVPEDDAKAVALYRRAAEQGYVTAQYNLGLMYVTGSGVPQDDVRAHKWFNLAASRGDDAARVNRDLAAERMTRDQNAEAQRLAREWLEKQPKR